MSLHKDIELKPVEIQLSQFEWESKCADLAACDDEIDAAEAEKKRVADQHANNIKYLHGRRRELGKAVKTHKEIRQVEHRWTKDHVNAEYVLYRCDTGQAVDRRPLTDEERQMPLPLSPVDDDFSAPESEIAQQAGRARKGKKKTEEVEA